ncbi:MAG: MnmC family methyltransferase [Planctomycetota bacterium]
MPPPQRPRLPTADERYDWIVTDDGSRTLEDKQLAETYHSGCGALAESWCVYLINSGVAERLFSREPTRVLEYGFGTGTAFFLTAAFAKVAGCPLSYISLENNLLPSELLADLPLEEHFLRATDALPLDSTPGDDREVFMRSLGEQLELVRERTCDLLSEHESESDRIHASGKARVFKVADQIELMLVLDDAQQFTADEQSRFHAIYFDPFSPDTNPELWTPEVFGHCHSLLLEGGTLTSYCVKGSVRRDLAQAGFAVHKLPGPPGGKREVLVATKT